MKSSSGGDFWKNFSLRGDFTPAQGRGVMWLPKRIEGSKIKGKRLSRIFSFKIMPLIHAKPQLYKELLVNLTIEYYYIVSTLHPLY